uniref:NADH-ubiquinone oxidoreductase chain 4L n=1 Tax=Ranina ranina TaxID=156228 RepID=W6JGW5_RANRA|nr:NADH dehydrogenase subunit 4L [Ranina ranina]AIK66989.1 NADH dehydrogenase subunit 4L [Ranina ranina]BAO48228.1 NADH dehydrogenase subunit 4L [Ranina ranina]
MLMYTMLLIIGSSFMVGCGLWSFISYQKHLLNSLLSLEFMMLGIFWLMSVMTDSVGSEIYFSLFFLTMAACEGALGLSLLIYIVRTHGNDCFSSFNMLEC